MRPEMAFPGKRVVKVKGGRKGRTGTVDHADLMTGLVYILFDDSNLVEQANPYEFECEKKPEPHP